jgi:hypothetical protein
MSETLAEKTCTRGGIPPLTGDEAQRFQAQAPNWELGDNARRIERTFRFRNFREALAFVQEVGDSPRPKALTPVIWELDDADKAEKLIRNLARRLEREAPGVAASILEGINEILTVTRLGLPSELRRSLACTNIIENMMGTIRQVCRNVKHWRSPAMALRWTAAAMLEAKKGFRRLKAHKKLAALRIALKAHYEKTSNNRDLAQTTMAA